MTMKIKGMDAFTTKFEGLAKDIAHINNMALYEAAGYVAKEIGKALQSLPTYEGRQEHRLYGATPSEKEQIIANFGISRFQQNDDGSQTSIGFTGYVDTPSARFNGRVPTGMLMQCIEYGTQFRKGTHTISKAIRAAQDQAIQKAENKLTTEIQKKMEE